MKKLGRTLNAIRCRREHAGLPPVSRYVFWDAKKLSLVGKLHDEDLAKRTGHPVGSVAAKRRQLGLPMPHSKLRRWTAEEDALLGTERDEVIAASIGCLPSAVADRRRKLGVARSGIREPRANVWKAEEISLLGTASDAEIARHIGRTIMAVKLRRQKLRVPTTKNQLTLMLK